MRETRTSGSTRGEVRALNRFLSYSTATREFLRGCKRTMYAPPPRTGHPPLWISGARQESDGNHQAVLGADRRSQKS